MNRLVCGALLVISTFVASSGLRPAPAFAQQPAQRSPPFTATLSNTMPLVTGMGIEDASRALGEPLSLVSGVPGNEIYLAIRDLGGSGLFKHKDRLYLQFRNGRLAGWKADWGHNWMWQ
jgi:hypothetical protein